MKITESSVEKYGGLLLAVFSLILYFIIIPLQVGDVKKAVVTPQSLPNALTLFMFFLSICLFISGYHKSKKSDQKIYTINISEIKLVVLSLVVIAVYILVIKYLGYLITTVIALAILMYAFGQRKLIKILSVSILVPIAIQLFFTNLMKIYLP